MKRVRSSLGVVAALMVLGVAAGAPAEEAKPTMLVPQLRYDLGRIFEAKEYIHDFVVKNRGSADLIIKEVKPTCGCTVAKFDRVIPAGGEGLINLAIDGSQVEGSFSKSAVVHSNDPELPLATLTLEGTEVPYIDVEPEARVQLQGRYGEEVEGRLTIRSNEEAKNFEVTGAESDMDDKITYKVEPGPGAGQFTLTVTKNPKLPVMASVGSLTLRTNSEHAPEKTIQVQVVTRGTISVQPSTVNYGAVQFAHDGVVGEPVHKSVTVTRDEGEFAIEKVEFDGDLYTATVQELIPGKRYQLDITFQPPVQTDPRQREVGEMTIHTSDPIEPQVRVKLVARAL